MIQRFLITICLSLIFSNALANEHAEAPPADAHGAAPAEAKGATPGSGAPPWTEVQMRMLVYKGQRQQLMNDMKALREEQNHLKMGTIEMKNKGIEIVKKYKEYRELTEEYNKLLVQLRYRFPERLAKEALKIHRTEEVPDLDELTTQMDLDARLSISLNRARELYGVPAPTGGVDGRGPSSEKSDAEKAASESPNLRESLPVEVRK